MARTKEAPIKKTRPVFALTATELGTEEHTDIFAKPRKAIEAEEQEAGTTVEEKPEGDVTGEEDGDPASDDAGIDDEELNPFGDKWEE